MQRNHADDGNFNVSLAYAIIYCMNIAYTMMIFVFRAIPFSNRDSFMLRETECILAK
jgi:hypothetical protein